MSPCLRKPSVVLSVPAEHSPQGTRPRPLFETKKSVYVGHRRLYHLLAVFRLRLLRVSSICLLVIPFPRPLHLFLFFFRLIAISPVLLLPLFPSLSHSLPSLSRLLPLHYVCIFQSVPVAFTLHLTLISRLLHNLITFPCISSMSRYC